jgi:hypothetical protein
VEEETLMAYHSSMGGLTAHTNGFGYYGLSGAYPIGGRSDDVLTMQRELQRLNFLEPGSGRFGADGYWGPRTAKALQDVARYVGYESAPYDPPNADQLRSGTVTVPDDLLDRMRGASPAPPGTTGVVTAQPANIWEMAEPAIEEPETLLVPSTAETSTRSNWVPAAIIGGGVLLVGAWMWYQQKPKKRVRANRKRRRRRRRRR